MPKYIDADALLAQMKDRRFYVGRRSDPVCLVEDAPAADVEPKRKPGHWAYNPGDNIPYCSECLMPQDSECNYCPSCGAKMIPEPPKGEENA